MLYHVAPHSQPHFTTLSLPESPKTPFPGPTSYEAQSAIPNSRTITLPRPDDQLRIVTDGTVRNPGIGATLYVTRGQKLHLAGFFSAKLCGTQSTWLPCEVEALLIAVATRRFNPFLHPLDAVGVAFAADIIKRSR